MMLPVFTKIFLTIVALHVIPLVFAVIEADAAPNQAVEDFADWLIIRSIQSGAVFLVLAIISWIWGV